MVLRVLPGLFGALFLYIAASWLLDPVGAAAGLQMELFDGAGRSSQIGDIGGFFLGSGSLLVLGAWRKSAALLRGAAIMVGAVGGHAHPGLGVPGRSLCDKLDRR